MTDIRSYPVFRHIRTEPSSFVLHYRRGVLRRSGRGLAFSFRPAVTSIVLVPMDDRELELVFHGRTSDFQDVTAQGVVTFRVEDPKLLADRIDFSIDLASGHYRRTPLEQLTSQIAQLAQQLTWEYIASTPLRTILVEGVDEVRRRIHEGLEAQGGLQEMGIRAIAVRIAAIQPTSSVAEALQTPARELIQQDADQATFQRRAIAVEKERAIEENELQNRIEIARRREQLVAQEGANARLHATEEAAADAIAARSAAERIAQVDGVRVQTERDRIAIYRDLSPHVLLALAAREAAAKLTTIEHLNITPDMLTPALSSLTRHLDAKAG